MYLQRILIVVFIFCFVISCAPYKMKAIRAKRDQNYQMAINFGLRHLRNHPDDQDIINLLEKSAEKLYSETKREIAHYEKIEDWQKVINIAAQTHLCFSKLIKIVGIQFPTNDELNYLAEIKERSNINKAEELYNQGLRFFNDGDLADALNKFTQCKKYIRHYKDVDELILNTNHKLAMTEYQQAMNLIQQKEHEQALQKLEKVIDYVPDFRDAHDQISYTRGQLAQQYYKKADIFTQQGKYKPAFKAVAKVLSYQSDYPGAQEKYNELQEKLTVRLAIFPFETKKLTSNFGEITFQNITSKVLSKKSQFLLLLDRQNLDKIFEEQALSQTGAIDEKTAVEVGKLSGVNTIVVGSVSLVSSSVSKPTKTTKTGHYKMSYLDPRKIKREKKLTFTYTKFEKKRSVEINLNYRIISVETGEILENKSVNKEKSDTATWVICAKERIKNLPSADKNRVGTPKEPKSKDSLINEAINILSQEAANLIISRLD